MSMYVLVGVGVNLAHSNSIASYLEPEESEKTPCLFAQGGKKMMEDLKSFDSKKFEKEECEKVVAPKELDIIEGESWVARITRSATKNAGRQ